MRSIVVFAGLVLAAAGIFGSYFGGDKPATKTTTPPVAASAVATAPSGPRNVVIPRDSRGHFQVGGMVDGRHVDFMIDTGASVIALSEREALRLGIRPGPADFNSPVKTANGVIKAAPVVLKSVDIKGLVVRNVPALVVPGNALSENLLGLSYLTKLRRFEYANGRMVLEN